MPIARRIPFLRSISALGWSVSHSKHLESVSRNKVIFSCTSGVKKYSNFGGKSWFHGYEMRARLAHFDVIMLFNGNSYNPLHHFFKHAHLYREGLKGKLRSFYISRPPRHRSIIYIGARGYVVSTEGLWHGLWKGCYSAAYLKPLP